MLELSTPQLPSAERDLQRAALRALVQLSERCAAREIEIDSQHTSEIEAANKELERTNWSIEERHKKQQEAIKEKYDTRMASAEAQYQRDFEALKHADSIARQRYDHDESDRRRD